MIAGGYARTVQFALFYVACRYEFNRIMKNIILTTLMICIATVCPGKKTYTLTKTDFIDQFTGRKVTETKTGLRGQLATEPANSTIGSIYCFAENGEKVWLYYNSGTQLTLKLNDNSSKIVLLRTVTISSDTIYAEEYNAWAPTNKISTFNLDDVTEFYIYRKFQERDMPYFNRDSSSRLTRLKNDSLKNTFATGSETILYFVAREKTEPDSFQLAAGACYHINFKDGNKTSFGIVEWITADSIGITSHMSAAMAVAAKEQYAVYKYSHKDISSIRLAKSDGFSSTTVNAGDYNINVKAVDKATYIYRGWYAWSTASGEIHFYRPYLMFKGFRAITEKGGRAIWYEGEPTQ